MSRFLKHTLRCVVFLAVLALLLTGVSQLVRPKNNTRSDGIHDPAANGILGEPDNTIDLLILGDSESYSAIEQAMEDVNTVTRPTAAAHPDRHCTIRKRSCTKPSKSSRPSL